MIVKIGEQCPKRYDVKAGSKYCFIACPYFISASANRETIRCEERDKKEGVMENADKTN